MLYMYIYIYIYISDILILQGDIYLCIYTYTVLHLYISKKRRQRQNDFENTTQVHKGCASFLRIPLIISILKLLFNRLETYHHEF